MLKFLALLLLCYLLLCGLYYLRQETILFYPQSIQLPGRSEFSDFEIEFERQGVRLHGWFVNRGISHQKPLIVYYGGNAEEVSGNLYDLDRYSDNSMLLINYRGYGESQGKPGEKDFYADALFILDSVIELAQIEYRDVVLMGRSMGSGVATYVAGERPVQALILIEPFDSFVALGRHHLPYLPVNWLLKHRFDSLQRAGQLSQPWLAIIAGRDEIIPTENSLNLINQWQGNTQTVLIEIATHNDINVYPEYWESIRNFLEAL